MVEKIGINLRNNFIRILRKMWIKIAVEILKNKSVKNTVKKWQKKIMEKIGK